MCKEHMWLKYRWVKMDIGLDIANTSGPMRSVHFGKLANHKIFLCYVSYLTEQTLEFLG